MKKSAIGITTFCGLPKRIKPIKTFFESFLDINKDIFNKYDVFISDDASTLEEYRVYLVTLNKYGFKLMLNAKNGGVARNGNRLLKVFKNFEYETFFRMEDDNIFLKDGLFDIYDMLLRESEEEHFSFIGHNYFKTSKDSKIVKTINNYNIQYHTATNGVLLSGTKKVLDTIGGFSVAPEKWGGSHIDFSNRCLNAKLIKGSKPDFKESNEYFKITDIGEHNSNFGHHERVKYGKVNTPWYKEQLEKRGLFREFIT
jgi:hypothetical protein